MYEQPERDYSSQRGELALTFDSHIWRQDRKLSDGLPTSAPLSIAYLLVPCEKNFLTDCGH